MGLIGFIFRSIKATAILGIGIILIAAVFGFGADILSENVDGVDIETEPEPIPEERVESEIIRLVNTERAERGLDNVTRYAYGDDIAKRHSQRMNETDRIAHAINGSTTDNRLSAAGCIPGGENVGHAYVREDIDMPEGTMYANSAEDVAEMHFRLWMDSEPHKENMMNPSWNRISVGVTLDGENSYAVQMFCG